MNFTSRQYWTLIILMAMFTITSMIGGAIFVHADDEPAPAVKPVEEPDKAPVKEEKKVEEKKPENAVKRYSCESFVTGSSSGSGVRELCERIRVFLNDPEKRVVNPQLKVRLSMSRIVAFMTYEVGDRLEYRYKVSLSYSENSGENDLDMLESAAKQAMNEPGYEVCSTDFAFGSERVLSAVITKKAK